jgi:hypothetical protein
VLEDLVEEEQEVPVVWAPGVRLTVVLVELPKRSFRMLNKR